MKRIYAVVAVLVVGAALAFGQSVSTWVGTGNYSAFQIKTDGKTRINVTPAGLVQFFTGTSQATPTAYIDATGNWVGGTSSSMDQSLITGGEWITPTFAAGNFTASDSMTWTVESGDVLLLKYTVIGKTAHVAFDIRNTVIGGTPSNILKVALPAAITPKSTMANPVWMLNNSTSQFGFVTPRADDPALWFYNVGSTTYTSGDTWVRGTVTYEIK